VRPDRKEKEEPTEKKSCNYSATGAWKKGLSREEANSMLAKKKKKGRKVRLRRNGRIGART